jgi:hypothetical protein
VYRLDEKRYQAAPAAAASNRTKANAILALLSASSFISIGPRSVGREHGQVA